MKLMVLRVFLRTGGEDCLAETETRGLPRQLAGLGADSGKPGGRPALPALSPRGPPSPGHKAGATEPSLWLWVFPWLSHK